MPMSGDADVGQCGRARFAACEQRPRGNVRNVGSHRTAPSRLPLLGAVAAVVAAVSLSAVAVVASRDDGVAVVARARTDPLKRASAEATATAETAPGVATSAPASPPATASASSSTPSTPSAASRPPPTLAVNLTGSSYVRVRLPSGGVLLAGVLHKGQHRTFRQKELVVTVGNSAAVDVSINGHARRPGRRAQVETFTARRK